MVFLMICLFRNGGVIIRQWLFLGFVEDKPFFFSDSVVGNKIIRKRIHVRIEHVQPSRCTEDLKLRKKRNDKLKAEAKVMGEVISTKRQPEGPKPGFMVEGATLETVTPIPYDVVNDLKGGYYRVPLCYCMEALYFFFVFF
ncbi:60S ribosomal protein L21-1 [Camellia lanceoleosa]|uniref:60S ribosomal protein L21-1 n=1 Tax=Camellia lanceoleosa TaxID=1840588 RepID=A0ACC0IMF5_9ERIC|nr:60S ribosomal protein L21-1 [Camellia lanceoleosa]